jgi:hypothetical protein
MPKESRISFRARSELKAELQAIAAREKRSVAQICELLLSDAVRNYEKQGPKYIQQLLMKDRK